jgi:C-terminal processing protease CtpA/Prc
MLAPLRDVHVYFRKPDGSAIPTYISPYQANFDINVLIQYGARNGARQVSAAWGYFLLDSIPYIGIGAWSSDFNVSDFDLVFEQFKNSPAMIIDVRMNGGGNDQLAYQVAGRFTKEYRAVGYVKTRNGPNHGDFTSLTSRVLLPRGTWQFDKPVVLLIGRKCFSSNESFISAMREIPNVTVIGDTTGGGSGNPTFFKLSNGYDYSVSRWIAYTADMKVIEWNGIPPDIYRKASPSDFVNGVDPVLEFALVWLKTKMPGRLVTSMN